MPTSLGISLVRSGLLPGFLWLVALVPCHGYAYAYAYTSIVPPPRATTTRRAASLGITISNHHHHRRNDNRRSSSTRRRQLLRQLPSALGVGSTGADYDYEYTGDFSIEAAIGKAQHYHASEYEQDAAFYRKRNEAYSEMLLKKSDTIDDNDHDNDGPDSDSSSSSFVTIATPHDDAIKASFDRVEATTNSLLRGNPLVALGIFCATGILVAYLSGFFFLEGYIENWNPAENDQVPYWGDAEIHTIERAKQ